MLNTKILLSIAGTLIAILTAIGVDQHRRAAERTAIEKRNSTLFKEVRASGYITPTGTSKAYQFKLP